MNNPFDIIDVYVHINEINDDLREYIRYYFLFIRIINSLNRNNINIFNNNNHRNQTFGVIMSYSPYGIGFEQLDDNPLMQILFLYFDIRHYINDLINNNYNLDYIKQNI